MGVRNGPPSLHMVTITTFPSLYGNDSNESVRNGRHRFEVKGYKLKKIDHQTVLIKQKPIQLREHLVFL